MEITPDKRQLIKLVEAASVGELCLPNFQRDFVWTRDAIADLLRSILRRYFIGSLLLLNCDPDKPPFAPIALRGSNAPKPERPKQLVLDGQQRLTSLIYALTAPDLGLRNSKKPRRFFIDLDLLAADPDDDDIVFDRTRREEKRDGLDTIEGQWARRVLPLSEMLTTDRFLTWRDKVDDLVSDDPDAREQFRKELRPRWTKAVNQFLEFQVPVVELPQVKEDDVDAIGRVCAIFEKLNSTGVALSVYDLLTARLYRSQIDLHGLWNEVVAEHTRLAAWSKGSADTNSFGVLVLRTLALLRGLDPKPKLLINLSPKQFEEDWRRAAAATERALELIEHTGQDGFGVFNEKWLPGFGLLPVLAALRAHIDDRKLGDVPRLELRQWYWSSVFLERYSSSVEAKSRRDYSEYTRRWNGEDVTPLVMTEAAGRIGSPTYSIRQSASFASAVYSGVFCLLARNNARDWRDAEDIALQKLEDHHIFPQAYLTKVGGLNTKADYARINSIANRTLISDKTNGSIGGRAPASYLDDSAIFKQGPELLLPAHFISPAGLGVLRSATNDLSASDVLAAYDKFIAARETVIIEHIRDVCGVQVHEASFEQDDEEEFEDD